MASPIDTPTLVSRRSCRCIPPHTRPVSQSATPATQHDMSTSSDTLRKTRFRGFVHRHANFSLTRVVQTRIPPHTRPVSQSATPATQHDMRTSSDTLRKTCFCGFPHRHAIFSATKVAHGRLRTVADTGSRVTQTCLHLQTPKM